MELEGYFEFLGPDDIRIKGTRIGVEFVLRDYREGASPEEIVLRYPTLSLAFMVSPQKKDAAVVRGVGVAPPVPIANPRVLTALCNGGLNR